MYVEEYMKTEEEQMNAWKKIEMKGSKNSRYQQYEEELRGNLQEKRENNEKKNNRTE